ncbi:Holliday junction branch migration protein RuvA [Nafulsella turpanensis]|uniref:Holliday junction branch migration protein RuvA n=1 Tax=Nafulsella turpanensis TaxID=1265690 RepID=UPI0003465FA4|nr:Holliday junction branch migration protein RuvA [Nafulsella turpanensis]
MIAYLQGKLAYKEPTRLIMDVQGIGYEVKISLHTYAALKEEENCRLFTYLHIKEDAHTLFGFKELAEKKMFLDLISISGVGPGTGLMILSSLNPEELQQAILNEEVRTIQAVKGVGAKTAQRIILELKDKIGKSDSLMASSSITAPSHNTVRNEALSALVTLGINRSVAEKNLNTILKSRSENISLEELIKLALKNS